MILDTEEPEYRAWQAVYTSYGTKLELEEWIACVGTSQEAFDPYQNLQARLNIPVNFEHVKLQRKKYFDQIMQNIAPMPGVMEYLEAAKKAGLQIGIASSSPFSWVMGYLKQLNIAPFFNTICVSEDVSKVKPDPALYSCVIRKMGIKPHEALAFEDSLNGLISAKRAGLICVAVPNTITRNLDFSLADMVINSLAEFPLTNLLTQFNS